MYQQWSIDKDPEIWYLGLSRNRTNVQWLGQNLENFSGKDPFSMLNLNSIMIGTKQPQVLADFYENVFGKPADMADRENGFFGWLVGSAYFSVLEHSEMAGNAKDPGRVMFNFETTEVIAEFERIKGVGGGVLREPYEMGGGWIATLIDPDGNYFQLVTPMEP